MKAICALLSILTIAGCASVAQQRTPDGYYDNSTLWQTNNTKLQEKCVAWVMIHAPAGASDEEMDYNLHLCMRKLNLFILNKAPTPSVAIGRNSSITRLYVRAT